MITYNFTVVAGEGYGFTVTVLDDGVAAVLPAGTTVRWGLWDAESALLIDLALGDGLVQTGASTVHVALTGADTTALRHGRYRHEMKVTVPGAEPDTVMVGTADVTASAIT